MAKSQPRILTEEYWHSFALTTEELDYLHQLVLNAGIPQTEAFLAYDLVERRCKQEEACVEEEPVEVLPYDPCQEYKVGQEIVVKDYRKREIIYLHGTVTGKRDLWMSSFGQCQAIRVRIGEGKTATSKEYVACAKRGFDDWKPIPVEQVVGEGWGLSQTDEYIAPGEVFERFQGYALRQLTRQLGADARFIRFGHEWFVPELLALVSENELATAARRIEQRGEPLPLHQFTRVPEMPRQNEDFVQQFSCYTFAVFPDHRGGKTRTKG